MIFSHCVFQWSLLILYQPLVCVDILAEADLLNAAVAMSTEDVVKDVLRGVSEADRASPITDVHIAMIAKETTRWERLAPFLDLSEAEEEEIAEDYKGDYELQKREALRLWKQKNGRRATYYQLVKILCERGHVALAEKVKEILISTECANTSSRSNIVAEIQKHFKDCYTKLLHQTSDTHLLLNSSAYVPLTLKLSKTQQGKQSKTQQGEQSSALSLSDVFQKVEATPTRREVILIEGAAGSGKTTLLQHAAQQWAAGELLQGVDLVIFVPLQYPFVRCAKSLTGIIPHPNERMRKEVADLITEQGGDKTCFIVDTWDEMPVKDHTESFVYNLIASTLGQSLPHCSIIVASRPEASAMLHKFATTKLEVNRFGESQVKQYIHSSIGQEHGEEAAIRLDEILKEKPEAASLCDLPINIVILTFLFCCFQQSLPDTRTELFRCFILSLLRKHLQERTSHEGDALRDFQSLPEGVLNKFRLVCHLAYHGIVSNKTTFDEQDLQGLKIGTPSITLKEASMFGFMQISHHLEWYGLEQSYSFLHHVVQDFLGAYHLSTLQKKKQITNFGKILKHSPLSLVLSFYAGLTQLNEPQIVTMLTDVAKRPLDDVSVLKGLHSGSDDRRLLLALLNCIYEAQKPDICLKINPPNCFHDRAFLDVNIFFGYLQLDPSDCACIGYFASNVCHKRSCGINLLGCRIGDSGVCLLLKDITEKKPRPFMRYPITNLHPGIDITTIPKEDQIGALMLPRCVELELTDNNLTHHGTRCIGKALRTTSVITLLHLGFNWHPSATNRGTAFKYLIEGLSRNTSCKFVSFLGMDLKPYHTHYLVLLIAVCKNLDCLSLESNACLGNSMLLLGSALKYNSNLTKFYADDCGITDQHLLALVDGLQHNQSMAHLCVDMNYYSVHAAVQLIRHLTSSSITIVTMDRIIQSNILLQEALWLANIERKRRGIDCELTIDTTSELPCQDNQAVRATVPQLVPEQLLRCKHVSQQQ